MEPKSLDADGLSDIENLAFWLFRAAAPFFSLGAATRNKKAGAANPG